LLADALPGALFHLAHICADRGDAVRAESCLRGALAHAPGDAGLWNNLGVVLATTGRAQAALDAFDRALTLRPNYFDARENLRRAQEGGAGEFKLTRRRLRAELMPLAATA
jgi:Flp pilus assembly protein TadD